LKDGAHSIKKLKYLRTQCCRGFAPFPQSHTTPLCVIGFSLFWIAIKITFVRRILISCDIIILNKLNMEMIKMEHVVKSESEIRTRYQITIPEEIRTRAKLNIGDSLLWQYDELRQEIIVMPKPKSFSDKLWGLGKNIWDQESTDDYIRKERDEW
jgi:bifunctional DNA-binding transcriptional regulator/antitoxin component of YhaV-PrlF toxin-antitoxin module